MYTCLLSRARILAWRVKGQTNSLFSGHCGPWTSPRSSVTQRPRILPLTRWTFLRQYFNLQSPRCLLATQSRITGVLKSKLPLPLSSAPFVPASCAGQARTVVNYSKLGKKKTVKAVARRFRRTGSGKLKFWPAGNVHNLLSKSHNYRRRVKKARYVNKTQLKTLNKMLASKWS